MRIWLIVAALLAACAPAAQAPAPAPEAAVVHDAPAGEYRLDLSHADLAFRVSHIGFSMYTGRFARWDATLNFDPANPEAMSVNASVDVSSLTLPVHRKASPRKCWAHNGSTSRNSRK